MGGANAKLTFEQVDAGVGARGVAGVAASVLAMAAKLVAVSAAGLAVVLAAEPVDVSVDRKRVVWGMGLASGGRGVVQKMNNG